MKLSYKSYNINFNLELYYLNYEKCEVFMYMVYN